MVITILKYKVIIVHKQYNSLTQPNPNRCFKILDCDTGTCIYSVKTTMMGTKW